MPRALWLLIIGMAVNVTGSSFLWPLNAIYIHDHLGKSLTVAGIVLMLNSAASVIGNLIGGNLFDKIGGYKSILIGIIITLLSLIGLTIWHGWPQYVIFLTITGFGSGIVFPSMYAMAGSVWKEGGRKAFNAIYVAQNVGVAAGSALGGIVASFSFEWIFLGNTVLYVIFFLIAFFGYKNITAAAVTTQLLVNEGQIINNRSRLHALLILCIGYLLCWVAYVQWQSTIAAYTQEINISIEQYSILWTINGAIIVLGQPFMNKLLTRIKSVKMQIIIGNIIFIVSFAVAASAGKFLWFIAAMTILTIGEMLIWPAVPTIASQLAPEGREGFYQGVVNSTATGGRMIGPLLGGLLVDLYGMSMLFTVLIALFIVSILTTLIYDRNLKENKKELSTI
jgi:MFS family permease